MEEYIYEKIAESAANVAQAKASLIESMLRKHMLQDMATPQQLARAGYMLLTDSHDDGKQVVKLVRIIDQISYQVKVYVDPNLEEN